MFTCDQIQTGAGTCINQDIIDKVGASIPPSAVQHLSVRQLQEHMELHQAKLPKDDYWKSVSYTKCESHTHKIGQRVQNLHDTRL